MTRVLVFIPVMLAGAMRYRNLGEDGSLRVSEAMLGTMTWGEQNTEAEAFEQLDYALEHGVNFIDTAEMYPVPTEAETQGLTDKYIGSWLKKGSTRREDIVLAGTTCHSPSLFLSFSLRSTLYRLPIHTLLV